MILIATLALECEGQLAPWYARVPPDSNCADAPSRHSVQQLLDLGVEQTCLDVKDCWEKCCSWEGSGEMDRPQLSPQLVKKVLLRENFS